MSVMSASGKCNDVNINGRSIIDVDINIIPSTFETIKLNKISKMLRCDDLT